MASNSSAVCARTAAWLPCPSSWSAPIPTPARPAASHSWASAPFLPNRFHPPRSGGNWSNFSMRPPRMLPPARLCAFALLAAPVLLAAQSSPEIAGIVARLDRLEQENRALTEQVRDLRAALAAARAPQVGQAPSPANPAPDQGPGS